VNGTAIKGERIGSSKEAMISETERQLIRETATRILVALVEGKPSGFDWDELARDTSVDLSISLARRLINKTNSL